MNSKWIYLLICLTLSVYLAITGFGSRLAFSENGFERVGLIFSVMTASLITTMSIVGVESHPNDLWANIWRLGKLNLSRLAYLIVLFFLFMLSLALIVFYETTQFNITNVIILWILGFLIPFSFLVSLPIPIVLFKIKSEQMNKRVDKARKKK